MPGSGDAFHPEASVAVGELGRYVPVTQIHEPPVERDEAPHHRRHERQCDHAAPHFESGQLPRLEAGSSGAALTKADHRQFSAFKRGDTAGIISPLHVVVDGEFSRIAFENWTIGPVNWTIGPSRSDPMLSPPLSYPPTVSGLGVDSYRGYRRRAASD